MITLIKKDIINNITNITPEICNTEKLNLIALKITTNKEDIFIIGCYVKSITAIKKSNDNTEHILFWETLQQIIDKIPTESKILIIGDMNTRLGMITGDHNKTRKEDFNLKQIQKLITRMILLNTTRTYGIQTWKCNNKSSIIDLAFVSPNLNQYIQNMKIEKHTKKLSDHRPIFINFNINITGNKIKRNSQYHICKTNNKCAPGFDTELNKQLQILKYFNKKLIKEK